MFTDASAASQGDQNDKTGQETEDGLYMTWAQSRDKDSLEQALAAEEASAACRATALLNLGKYHDDVREEDIVTLDSPEAWAVFVDDTLASEEDHPPAANHLTRVWLYWSGQMPLRGEDERTDEDRATTLAVLATFLVDYVSAEVGHSTLLTLREWAEAALA